MKKPENIIKFSVNEYIQKARREYPAPIYTRQIVMIQSTIQSNRRHQQLIAVNQWCDKIQEYKFPNLREAFFPNFLKENQLQILMKAEWPNLQILKFEGKSFDNNQIMTEKQFQSQKKDIYKRWEAISKGKWPKLQKLRISSGILKEIGCKHLTEGEWSNLIILDLCDNKIGDGGCKWLRKGNWPNLQKLLIDNNEISDLGISFLCQANWINLTRISLRDNHIKAYGCKLLAKKGKADEQRESSYLEFVSIYRVDMIVSISSQWGKLMSLKISKGYYHDHYSRIGSQGCLYLSRAQWPLLENLQIDDYIRVEGCEHLAKAQWKSLKNINIKSNALRQSIMRIIGKADWPKLEPFDIVQFRQEKYYQVVYFNPLILANPIITNDHVI